jgi:HSP20 family protein
MFGLVPFDRRRNQMQPRESNFLDMDRVFENFFNDSVFPTYFSRSGMMRVDIREEEGAYLLDAELPGVNKENVNIEVADGRLTISVNQEEQAEEKNENYLRHERRSYTLCRSFSIDNIDADKISAKMENGVLSLRLPKSEPEKQQSRKIDIG